MNANCLAPHILVSRGRLRFAINLTADLVISDPRYLKLAPRCLDDTRPIPHCGQIMQRVFRTLHAIESFAPLNEPWMVFYCHLNSLTPASTIRQCGHLVSSRPGLRRRSPGTLRWWKE